MGIELYRLSGNFQEVKKVHESQDPYLRYEYVDLQRGPLTMKHQSTLF